MDQGQFWNLRDLSSGILRQISGGITSRVFVGENVMLSIVDLAPGAAGEVHHHDEEQWGVMLEGEAVRIQGDREVRVAKGDFWLTPGGVPHGVVAGPNGALLIDIFSPPRSVYREPGVGLGALTTKDD